MTNKRIGSNKKYIIDLYQGFKFNLGIYYI